MEAGQKTQNKYKKKWNWMAKGGDKKKGENIKGRPREESGDWRTARIQRAGKDMAVSR